MIGHTKNATMVNFILTQCHILKQLITCVRV